jgi:hypothetical protein
MRKQLSPCSLQLILLVAVGLLGASNVHAECSDRHIIDLYKKDRSVSDIARLCGMSRDDVLEALGSANSDDTDDTSQDNRPPSRGRGGLPSGTQIIQCGCWGYVAPGARAANPACASGIEGAVACGILCPAGGVAWTRVCL